MQYMCRPIILSKLNCHLGDYVVIVLITVRYVTNKLYT